MIYNQAEAERSRRARIISALAEEQAAGKLLEAGKLIDQSPSAIKLRLYQTLANIWTEKNSTILFSHSQKRLCLEKGKQRKRKEKKDIYRNHNPIDFQISATSSRYKYTTLAEQQLHFELANRRLLHSLSGARSRRVTYLLVLTKQSVCNAAYTNRLP
jgi:hypothetical protein